MGSLKGTTGSLGLWHRSAVQHPQYELRNIPQVRLGVLGERGWDGDGERLQLQMGMQAGLSLKGASGFERLRVVTRQRARTSDLSVLGVWTFRTWRAEFGDQFSFKRLGYRHNRSLQLKV